MSNADAKTPNKADLAAEREAERKKRLAEALRENLRKRKAAKPKREGDPAD